MENYLTIYTGILIRYFDFQRLLPTKQAKYLPLIQFNDDRRTSVKLVQHGHLSKTYFCLKSLL